MFGNHNAVSQGGFLLIEEPRHNYYPMKLTT